MVNVNDSISGNYGKSTQDNKINSLLITMSQLQSITFNNLTKFIQITAKAAIAEQKDSSKIIPPSDININNLLDIIKRIQQEKTVSNANCMASLDIIEKQLLAALPK